MQFARWVFRIAGIVGLMMLLTMYFLEEQIGRDQPPPIAHPEFFYGLVGVAVAWQFAFLVISLDPPRYRLLMLPAVIEKESLLFFRSRGAVHRGPAGAAYVGGGVARCYVGFAVRRFLLGLRPAILVAETIWRILFFI